MSEELVEAVAAAMPPIPWEQVPPKDREWWRVRARAAIAAVRDHDEAERKAKLAAEDEAFRVWSEGVTARIKALGSNVDRSKDGRERAANG